MEGESRCPYCESLLIDTDLGEHLESCLVYNDLDIMMGRHFRSSISSRLYSALRESRSITISSDDDEEALSLNTDLNDSLVVVYHNPQRPDQSEEVKQLRQPRRSANAAPAQKPPVRPPSGNTYKSSKASCPICYNEYNSTQNMPLVLPSCGHTVCDTCLQHMSDTYYSLKCPVCRTHNFQGVETLPVNYALLELTDKADDKEMCEQHGLEILGFCKDEEVLLCGACVFEHKSHASFLLNSPEATAWADSKKKLLEDKESSLKHMQSNWDKAYKSFKRHISNLNSEAKNHIEALKKTEAKLIESIKQGTKNCMSQITDIVGNKQLETRQQKFTDQLKKFQTEISRLNHLRQNYDQSSVIERLRAPRLPELEEDPPSMKDCMHIIGLLNIEVDYEAAIKSSKVPLRRSE